MDEKRAILAVVLIFVVLFGFNFWQSQQRAKVAADQAGTVEAGEQVESAPYVDVPAGDEGARGSTDPDASSQVEDAQGETDTGEAPTAGEFADRPSPERLTTIETPLWTATLTSRGAAIASWELAEYANRLGPEDERDGTPVALVSPGERGLAMQLDYGPTTFDVDAWSFESDAPALLVLGEGRPSAVVTYSAEGPGGVRVVREYTFYADSYAFDSSVSVEGLTEPTGHRRVWVGWPGVRPTEVKEDNRAAASVARVDGGIAKDGLGRFKETTEFPRVGSIEWVTTQSRYFVAALAPDGIACTESRAVGDREARTVGFKAAVPIEEAGGTVRFRVFAGPQDYRLISEMGLGLERAIDMGWSLTRPLSVWVLKALVWAHNYIPNYGVIIILFSILTKLLFYRLTHKSFTEMKRMQDLQPKLNALKEKHGDDKEVLAKAQMDLYKKEGVNPLGSCLPMLLQMPVFIALFQVLRTTIELRGAPFMLWITDLSQPDTIFTVAGFAIHVLPLLMGAGMLLQQKFTTSDPSQAAMTKMMPILFTVLFYNFASGLVVYWLVNTVLSIAQQYYIHRGPSSSVEVSTDAAAPGGVPPSAPASVTAVPEFEEAEVVTESDQKSGSGTNSGKKSRGRRRRKKK